MTTPIDAEPLGASPLDAKAMAEIYLKVSEGHRQRLTTLHSNEWQMAIVFWSAIAGTTAVSVANAKSLFPLPQTGFLLLGFAYLIAGLAYLFGFCRTNYASLSTERQRYVYFQNQALLATHAAIRRDLVHDGKEGTVLTPEAALAPVMDAGDNPIPGTEPRPSSSFLRSAVWRFKVLSTSLVTTAGLTVVANLDRIAMSGRLESHVTEYFAVGMFFGLLVLVSLVLNGRAITEVLAATTR